MNFATSKLTSLNAHVHFHCEDGQVHFAEAAALTPEDVTAPSPKREWLYADNIVVLTCVCNDLGAHCQPTI